MTENTAAAQSFLSLHVLGAGTLDADCREQLSTEDLLDKLKDDFKKQV